HTDDAPGLFVGVGRPVGELHAAGLAAAAGLHLRLDDYLRDAFRRERGGDLPRLLGGIGDLVFRHRNAVLGEEFLSLILEQVHWGSDLCPLDCVWLTPRRAAFTSSVARDTTRPLAGRPMYEPLCRESRHIINRPPRSSAPARQRGHRGVRGAA